MEGSAHEQGHGATRTRREILHPPVSVSYITALKSCIISYLWMKLCTIMYVVFANIASVWTGFFACPSHVTETLRLLCYHLRHSWVNYLLDDFTPLTLPLPHTIDQLGQYFPQRWPTSFGRYAALVTSAPSVSFEVEIGTRPKLENSLAAVSHVKCWPDVQCSSYEHWPRLLCKIWWVTVNSVIPDNNNETHNNASSSEAIPSSSVSSSVSRS